MRQISNKKSSETHYSDIDYARNISNCSNFSASQSTSHW